MKLHCGMARKRMTGNFLSGGSTFPASKINFKKLQLNAKEYW